MGPGFPLRTLSRALRCAQAGDTLVLQAGTYAGDTGVVTQPGLTLRGLGAGATLAAQGRHAEGKAILVVRAPGVRLENLEFRGARVPSGNGAGIRFEAGSLWLDRRRLLDHEMGLLHGSPPELQLAGDERAFGE